MDIIRGEKSKKIFKEFCAAKRHYIPIFQNYFWFNDCWNLDWDINLIMEENNIKAFIPFVVNKRFKKTTLTMPPLTPFVGPWLQDNNLNSKRSLAYDKKYLNLIIESLPKYSIFSQSFSYSLKNWLPFYWEGFSQSTRYSYFIKKNTTKKLFQNFSSAYRNKINNAKNKLKVESKDNPKLFYDFWQKSFINKNIECPLTFPEFIKFDKTLNTQRSRKMFFAKDEKENVNAVLYLIWDSNSSYLHLLGHDYRNKNKGASLLLIWESIKYTFNNLNLNYFDFEGSMIKELELVRRDCGAIPKQYFSIYKCNSRLIKIANFLKNF